MNSVEALLQNYRDFARSKWQTNVVGNKTDIISKISKDLAVLIFIQHLKIDLPACALVCRKWKAIADDSGVYKATILDWAFRAKDWIVHYGKKPGHEPRLPRCLARDLVGRSAEVWTLTLVPETLDGVKLDLWLMGELACKPLKGPSTNYCQHAVYDMLDYSKVTRSYWLLKMKDIHPLTHTKTFDNMMEIIQKANLRIPTLRDCIISGFTNAAKNGLYFSDITHYAKTLAHYNEDSPKPDELKYANARTSILSVTVSFNDDPSSENSINVTTGENNARCWGCGISGVAHRHRSPQVSESP